MNAFSQQGGIQNLTTEHILIERIVQTAQNRKAAIQFQYDGLGLRVIRTMSAEDITV
jgi:YD repeat-containing protein